MRGCVGVAIIFQDSATTDLLAETGKIGCKQDSTPMDPNLKLCKVKEDNSRQKDVSDTGWKINIFVSQTTGHCSFSECH